MFFRITCGLTLYHPLRITASYKCIILSEYILSFLIFSAGNFAMKYRISFCLECWNIIICALNAWFKIAVVVDPKKRYDAVLCCGSQPVKKTILALWEFSLNQTACQCNPFDNLVISQSSIKPKFTRIEPSLTVGLDLKKKKKSVVKVPLIWLLPGH